MIVEFDNWGTCHSESGFTVEMPTAPMVGESVTLEVEVLPEKYREQVSDPDMIDLIVTDRKFYVTSRGTVVQCNVNLPEV